MHSPETSDSDVGIAKHDSTNATDLRRSCTPFVRSIRVYVVLGSICILHQRYFCITMIIPRFSLLKCLCHCSSATDKVINFTERSWKTFKLAAETRQNEIYKKTFLGKLPSEISFPHDCYHRLCYQIYTSSSKLKRYSSSSINDLKEHTFSPSQRSQKPDCLCQILV